MDDVSLQVLQCQMIFPEGDENWLNGPLERPRIAKGPHNRLLAGFRREELPKRGNTMHEVKVYDSAGKLKKVISVNTLNKREDRKAESPDLFRKNKRNSKARTAVPKTQAKAKASQP